MGNDYRLVQWNGRDSYAAGSNSLEWTVTPELGGRITSLVFDGEEVLFTMPELRARELDVAAAPDVRARKRELDWLLWGGDKTWLAPQEGWTDALPFLDLDSGRYSPRVAGSAIEVTSPICRETGVQITRAISLDDRGRIRIDQQMRNGSDNPVAWGLWGVTQVEGSGVAVLPIRPDSEFDGGIKPYPNEGRSPEIMDRYIRRARDVAFIQCRQAEQFKYGSDSREGWILGLLDRRPDQWLAFLKTFPTENSSPYPHTSTIEVFDSPSYPYFELETHSPLRRLAPGETGSHGEAWTLGWIAKSADAGAIREWVAEHHSQQGEFS